MKNTETKPYPPKSPYLPYLEERINPEDYDDNPVTRGERVDWLFKTFEAEYVHGHNKYQNRQTLMAEWLQGLPSAIDIPFYNVEILHLAENMGSWARPPQGTSPEAIEKAEGIILENYWTFMACQLHRLRDWHRRNPYQ